MRIQTVNAGLPAFGAVFKAKRLSEHSERKSNRIMLQPLPDQPGGKTVTVAEGLQEDIADRMGFEFTYAPSQANGYGRGDLVTFDQIPAYMSKSNDGDELVTIYTEDDYTTHIKTL